MLRWKAEKFLSLSTLASAWLIPFLDQGLGRKKKKMRRMPKGVRNRAERRLFGRNSKAKYTIQGLRVVSARGAEKV